MAKGPVFEWSCHLYSVHYASDTEEASYRLFNADRQAGKSWIHILIVLGMHVQSLFQKHILYPLDKKSVVMRNAIITLWYSLKHARTHTIEGPVLAGT